MDIAGYKELGSLGVILISVLWAGRMLLTWFTGEMTRKNDQLVRQTERVDGLVEQLVVVMRDTQAAHGAMAQALATIATELRTTRTANATEHQAIVDCTRGMKQG